MMYFIVGFAVKIIIIIVVVVVVVVVIISPASAAVKLIVGICNLRE
jgi:hypothetical protein